MKPLTTIAQHTSADGAPLRLLERDGTYFLERDSDLLANSRATLPVRRMLELACQPFRPARQPSVLIDSLKLGTALHAAAKQLPQKGTGLLLAEPDETLISWHRQHLAALHPEMLDDPRIDLQPEPAIEVVRKAHLTISLIVVDCPGAPSRSNDLHPLLDRRGLPLAHDALKDGGLLVVSSPHRDKSFRRALEKTGFQVAEESSPPSEKSKSKRLHSIWIARKGHYQGQHRAKPTRS